MCGPALTLVLAFIRKTFRFESDGNPLFHFGECQPVSLSVMRRPALMLVVTFLMSSVGSWLVCDVTGLLIKSMTRIERFPLRRGTAAPGEGEAPQGDVDRV